MKAREVTEFLAEHADALNRGSEIGVSDSYSWLSERYHAELGQLLSLLALAQAIKSVLTPLPAPEPFRSELYRQLLQSPPLLDKRQNPVRSRFVLLSAAIVGLALIALRRLWLDHCQNQSQPMTTAV